MWKGYNLSLVGDERELVSAAKLRTARNTTRQDAGKILKKPDFIIQPRSVGIRQNDVKRAAFTGGILIGNFAERGLPSIRSV